MTDVNNGELKFEISRVPNRASVPLNEDMNSEQFEHCSVCVPIQLRVQQHNHEQNLSLGHEFQSPNNAYTVLLRWKDEMKVTKSTRGFKQLCNGKRRI